MVVLFYSDWEDMGKKVVMVILIAGERLNTCYLIRNWTPRSNFSVTSGVQPSYYVIKVSSINALWLYWAVLPFSKSTSRDIPSLLIIFRIKNRCRNISIGLRGFIENIVPIINDH